jgi:hypothetical protein
MWKQYNTLAKFYVQLEPEHPLTKNQIIALLKQRTRKISNREYVQQIALA